MHLSAYSASVDLAAPYRAVIPSLDGPVLRVLAGAHRPLSGLQIHRLAGTASANGVRKVLARLVEHGLVSATRAGASWMYEANRAHLAWPAVEQLIGIPAEFVRRLRAQVATWKVAPVCVGLFGSAARGDGATGSDIDLLVVRPDTVSDTVSDADPRGLRAAERRAATWEQQVQELRQAVLAMTGNHAQVLELSTTALRNTVVHGEPIVAEWKRDLVLISGDAPWAIATSLLTSGSADLEVAR